MKKGTILICHTDLTMDDSGDIEATKGKEYRVEERRETDFSIIDDSGDIHWFDIHKKNDEPDYTDWFKIKP